MPQNISDLSVQMNVYLPFLEEFSGIEDIIPRDHTSPQYKRQFTWCVSYFSLLGEDVYLSLFVQLSNAAGCASTTSPS